MREAQNDSSTTHAHPRRRTLDATASEPLSSSQAQPAQRATSWDPHPPTTVEPRDTTNNETAPIVSDNKRINALIAELTTVLDQERQLEASNTEAPPGVEDIIPAQPRRRFYEDGGVCLAGGPVGHHGKVEVEDVPPAYRTY